MVETRHIRKVTRLNFILRLMVVVDPPLVKGGTDDGQSHDGILVYLAEKLNPAAPGCQRIDSLPLYCMTADRKLPGNAFRQFFREPGVGIAGNQDIHFKSSFIPNYKRANSCFASRSQLIIL
jgi:hypothetical protein